VNDSGARRHGRRSQALGLLLLVCLLGLLLASFSDYGIMLDEGLQHRYGRRLVRAYASWGSDLSATTQNNLYLYGGFFELVAQAAEWAFPFGVYENRHLLNVLFGFVGFVAVWGIGSRLFGPGAGALAVLLLALTPSYYGQLFANPKDVPFASLYALAAWLALRGSAQARPGWRSVVSTAVEIGLAAAIRVVGLSLVPMTLVLWVVMRFVRAPQDGFALAGLRRLGLAAIVILAVSWSVMIAFWPWALLDPLRHPLQAWGKFGHFWNVDVLFRGRMVPAEELPRTYILQMLALKLPEIYPLALLLGLVSALRAPWRRLLQDRVARERLCEGAWVLMLLAAPVSWVIVNRTPLYHECRHLLFVLPFLATLAAVGISAFFASRFPRPVRVAAVLLLASGAVATVVDMVQLHPYEYVYYNRLFAGGLRGAVDRYETDYYIASYREGVDWAVAHYGGKRRRERVRIAAVTTGFPVAYYLSRPEQRVREFAAVTVSEDPHLVFASSSAREQARVTGRVVHVVERQGAPLLYVIETKPPE
jgi:hypothetical protein